jgi:DNA-directed RNA polymerase subunit RPC12/RpoP
MLTNKWGWWTNMSSKPRLWQWAKKWLKDRSWIVYDSEFMEELKTFQKESPEDRGAAAEEGMHDDVAIAAFIALYTSHDMDFSDSSEVPSPLKINTNSETQPQSSWTASCTRCMGPAWQVDNPEGVRCPYCQCRIIKAVPNHAARREVEIDFDEVGREPSEEPEVSKTSFEYSLGFR